MARKLGGTYNTSTGGYDLARRLTELTLAVNLAASAMRIGNLDEALAILEAARSGDAKTPLNIDPMTTKQLLEKQAKSVGMQPLPLSTRERQVLALVAQGFESVEIGRRLHISVHTVKSHLARIYKALGVKSRAAAVAVALEAGQATDA